MIITKFNSYFDKHGKATYLVLCIVIAVIFVFTVGSGDNSCTGQERLTSIGHMYGRNLNIDDVMRKGSQLRLFYAMNNRRLPARTNDFEFIQLTLEKMRLVHEAHEKDLDKITDEEFADAIIELPYWKISDKDHSGNELDSTETVFTQARFKRFVENVVKQQYKLTGEDFDEMIKDDILANRVIENATKDIKADPAAVRTVAAESTLKVATFPQNLERDSRPADAEIDAFLKDRSAELTEKDKMTDFFLVAYRDYADIFKAAEKDKKLAEEINPTDAEIKAFFDKNAATLFKDKKLEDVKEQITKSVKDSKAEAWLKARFAAFSADIAKPVPAKGTRYAQFRSAVFANKLKLATQNGLPEGTFVGNIDMQQKALVEAIKSIKALDAPTALTPIAGDAGDCGFAIAMKVDNPNKEANIRNAAANVLRGEKALVMFDEKILKPYQDKLAGKKTIADFIMTEIHTGVEENMTDPASYIAEINANQSIQNGVVQFITEADGKLTIEKPAKNDDKLLRWYNREMANAAAKKRAEEALAAFQKDLKDGKTLEAADTQKRFVAAKKPLSWYNAINMALQMVQRQMYMSRGPVTPQDLKQAEHFGFSMTGTQTGVSARNIPELCAELDKLGDNALLPKPIASTQGYILVYQVKRIMPEGDEGKKQAEAAENMIVNQLKSKAIETLKADLLAKSNTKLADEILPRTEAEEK